MGTYDEEPLAEWEKELLYGVSEDEKDEPVGLRMQKALNAGLVVENPNPRPKYPTLAKVGEPPNRWSTYWLWWLGMIVTLFAIPEAHAVLNKQKGDTLSENIREWLKTDTPGGGRSWLSIVALLMGILVWLSGHIMEWWP